MKKYAVGDVVMVPMKVTAVHPQGFPSGVEVHGEGDAQVVRAKNPLEKETPDTVIAEIPAGVDVDAHGQIHFSAGIDL